MICTVKDPQNSVIISSYHTIWLVCKCSGSGIQSHAEALNKSILSQHRASALFIFECLR